MGWSSTTLAKTEGGLGIKNLIHTQTALMAKTIFTLLNTDDKHWVQILNWKYGSFNMWTSSNHRNTSWFYKGICKIANKIRMNLWLNECDPETISFLMDPWGFEIPLALKPTFLNMNLPIEELNVSNFLQDGKLNYDAVTDYLSTHIDWSRFAKMRLEVARPNHWVWIHNSSSARLASVGI